MLIADDDPRSRRRLRYMLEQHPDLDIVGEAATGEDTLELAGTLHPTVIFLDVRMPPPSGLEAARLLMQMNPAPHIVFVTAHDDHAVDAFELQASDYLVKPVSRARLTQTLDRIRGLLEEKKLAEEQDRLRRQLEELTLQSFTDPLTGAYNRRYLDGRLSEEIKRALRHRHELSVILLDVDHFKAINDNHGHPVGDAVLRELCERLRPALRETDLLVRYGGEEFLLVLPETGLEGAQRVAEKLLGLVRESEFPGGLLVTASIGVACLRTSEAGEALIGRADEALYRAKGWGRNQVVSAGP